MKALLTLTTLLSLSVSAQAADVVIQEVPEVVAGFSWSGIYVGAHGGYSWGEGDLVDLFCEPLIAGRCTDDAVGRPTFGLPGTFRGHTDSDDFFGGVHLGYNHQFSGGFVLGAEGDINFGRQFDGQFFFGENFGFTGEDAINVNAIGEIDLDWDGSARLKAGFAFDRILPYVTGGVAFAQYDASFSDPDRTDAPRFGEGSLVGYTLGAGLDYAATDNVIVGAEYRFTDLGSDTVGLTNAALDADIHAYEVRDLEMHDIRLKISYKF